MASMAAAAPAAGGAGAFCTAAPALTYTAAGPSGSGPSSAPLLAGRRVLRVIVGKGLHSSGGEASLPRVVEAWLLEQGYRWEGGWAGGWWGGGWVCMGGRMRVAGGDASGLHGTRRGHAGLGAHCAQQSANVCVCVCVCVSSCAPGLAANARCLGQRL